MTALARRVRIGDWLVPYDDATIEVRIHRNLADILRATPGDDQDCMNSLCIKAARNEKAFPHPVLLVSTIATRVYVVDEMIVEGEDVMPSHCVRYELSEHDSRLIREHDAYGAGEPGELRLRIPRDPKGSPKRAAASQRGRFGADGGGRYSGDGTRTREPHPVTSLGAMARYKVAVGALKDLR